MQYLLGIDIGTSATKTVLFDARCVAVAAASRSYPLSQPRDGWAEQDPEDWYAAVRATVRETLEKAKIDGRFVAAIGLSGQMHSLVLLDEHDRAIRPAILWRDQRTAAECGEITAKIGAARVAEITANPVLTGFTAAKIRWVQKHEPRSYARCRHILLPKDYIRLRLTGEYATEFSDASGTQLMDVPNRVWSREMLTALEIDPAFLPKICESSEITGTVHSEAAADLGLSAATVVVGGAADNAAAAVGTGTVKAGRAFTTIGTSGVLFAHVDCPAIDPAGRLHTFCHAVPGAWTVMGCTLSAGASLSWYLDRLCEPYREEARRAKRSIYSIVDERAAAAPIGANGLFFLPYLTGERSPLLDPYARGIFFGLSSVHRREDLLRAVMEGVAYSLKDCRELLGAMGLTFDAMTVCGGGARSPLWRQMLADMYGCKVRTEAGREGGASLGAAILAAVGAGFYGSVREAADAVVRMDESCRSIAANRDYYDQGYALYRAVYQATKQLHQSLEALRNGSESVFGQS